MKKEFFCEKQKKKNINRLLISVNVRGSAGPLRFVVNENDKVSGVIEMALKQYDRQGRLPVLGSDNNNFFLLPSTLGLEGPLRFVVNENDKVSGVIEMALKQYDRQGRLPVLGSDNNNFFLLPSILGLEALGDSEMIGSCGVRNFILCKKQSWKAQPEGIMIDEKRKSWKTWLNKSFSFKIHSH